MTHASQAGTRGVRPGRRVAFALTAALCLAVPAGAWAQRHGGEGARAAQRQAARPEHRQERAAPQRRQETRPSERKPSPARPVEPNRNGAENRGGNSRQAGPAGAENFVGRPGGPEAGRRMLGPGVNPLPNGGIARRPGHLGDWLSQHQNLSPQQQENLLRREPGFNRLGPEQQQRVLNRLRSLDSRPPAVRQRLLQRNEMFERLSPEQRQDVRAASQAVRQMPEDRQQMVRRAFNDLRRIPPDQRQAILNSARFEHTYTPQERHVLGNLLSIEPYEPQ